MQFNMPSLVNRLDAVSENLFCFGFKGTYFNMTSVHTLAKCQPSVFGAPDLKMLDLYCWGTSGSSLCMHRS